MRLSEQVRTPIVDTVTGRATSASIVIKADYRLVSIPEGDSHFGVYAQVRKPTDADTTVVFKNFKVTRGQ